MLFITLEGHFSYNKDVTRPNNLRIDLSRLAKGKRNKLSLKITEKISLNRPGAECEEEPTYNHHKCLKDYFDARYIICHAKKLILKRELSGVVVFFLGRWMPQNIP